MADETRAALIRRLHHHERCSIAEIAGHLNIYAKDVRWALFGPTAGRRSRARVRRLNRWAIHLPTESGPLACSLGLRVHA